MIEEKYRHIKKIPVCFGQAKFDILQYEQDKMDMAEHKIRSDNHITEYNKRRNQP